MASKRKSIFLGIAISLALIAGYALALPTASVLEKVQFKEVAKSYQTPVVSAWGIGLNTESDSYLVARIHVVTTKTLNRVDVHGILQQARAENVTNWTIIRNRVNEAIQSNTVISTKGRISINKTIYVLTNVQRTNTTFAADIRQKPDYTVCVSANKTADQCENEAAKVGDISVSRKNAEFEPSKDRIWAGTLNFNSKAYTFVGVVTPKAG